MHEIMKLNRSKSACRIHWVEIEAGWWLARVQQSSCCCPYTRCTTRREAATGRKPACLHRAVMLLPLLVLTALLSPSHAAETTKAVFSTDSKLGLSFAQPSTDVPVKLTKISETAAAIHPQLQLGMALIGVQDMDVQSMPVGDVMGLIKGSSRPLVLEFAAAQPEKCPDSADDASCTDDERPGAAPAGGSGKDEPGVDDGGAGDGGEVAKELGEGEIAGCTDLPVPNVTAGEYIIDYANILGEEAQTQLRELLKVGTRNTTMQPMVLTVADIPQPDADRKLHKSQLLRSFGNSLCRHWFPGSVALQSKAVVYIIQSAFTPPRLDIYTGKRAKAKLKDAKIRGLLRHPNITKGLGSDPPDFQRVLSTAIGRTIHTLQASSSMLFGDGGGGLRGLVPMLLGGCFFLYFNSKKNGRNARGGRFGRGGGGGGLDMEMERNLEGMMRTMNPEDAGQLRSAMDSSRGRSGAGAGMGRSMGGFGGGRRGGGGDGRSFEAQRGGFGGRSGASRMATRDPRFKGGGSSTHDDY